MGRGDGKAREREREQVLNLLGQRPLVLVGMMGAGKTTVGRRLAARLGRRFLDSDDEIEKAANMSIEEMFASHGETEFRSGEARVIARLLREENLVLATGGGAFVNPETRAQILEAGVSVWLKADVEVLFARVSRRSNRPLLKTANPKETLRKLIETRYPIYANAHITVLSRDVPQDAVASDVMAALVSALAVSAPSSGAA